MANQRKLTDNQIHLLKLIYKFRFVTADLLSEYRNQSNSTIHDSLSRLQQRGLINRRYDNQDKIHGRPAGYFLESGGVKELNDHIEVNDRIAHSYYKNKSVSPDFVDHCLHIFQAYNNFRADYGDKVSMLAKAELADYDQFPATTPDLFIQHQDNGKQYNLYIYENAHWFVVDKHIKQNINHCEEDEWPGQYPNLLMACPSLRTQQKLLRKYETNLEDFDMYFTTTEALLSGDQKIWVEPASPETMITKG